MIKITGQKAIVSLPLTHSKNQRHSSFFPFLLRLFFKTNFRFMMKLIGRHRDFPNMFCPHTCINSPTTMSFHDFIAHFYLVLSNIPLPACTTVYLSIHQLKDTLVDSNVLKTFSFLLKPLIFLNYSQSEQYTALPSKAGKGIY